MKSRKWWFLTPAVLGVMTVPPAKTAPKVFKAHADIQGVVNSGITGDAQFIQTEDGVVPNVRVIVHVRGLPPNTSHGLHIHEIGVCTPPGYTSAGGHFDPGPNSNSNPDGNHPFHMGDLNSLTANGAGNANLEYVTSRISLSPGPLSILDENGSAIIVHLNPDQGITGAPGSGVAGGPRIACGVVVPD
jgi:Cu-Zn family superoxide dismutase